MPLQGPRAPKFQTYNSKYSQPVPIQDDQAAYTPPPASPTKPPLSPAPTGSSRSTVPTNGPASGGGAGAIAAGSSSPSRPSGSSGAGGGGDLASLPPDSRVKLVCVGDGGCGKTCLLVTYAHGTFPEKYVPTVFENYLSKVRSSSGKVIELALWDTAGQEEYDRLRALSYPEANVVLICFAVDAPVSLDNVYDKWIPEVAHHCPGVPILLIGLKNDLRNDATSLEYLQSKGQRPLTTEQGKIAASRCGAVRYLECSARQGQGISEVFTTAMSIVLGENKRTLRIPSVSRQQPIHPSVAQELPRSSSQTYDKPIKRRRKCVIL